MAAALLFEGPVIDANACFLREIGAVLVLVPVTTLYHEVLFDLLRIILFERFVLCLKVLNMINPAKITHKLIVIVADVQFFNVLLNMASTSAFTPALSLLSVATKKNVCLALALVVHPVVRVQLRRHSFML